MINLLTDSRSYQKQRILISARQRFGKYLEPSKVNVLGEHDVFTLTMLYMNGPHKILKFICQKQPSHPRNICTEH